MSFYVGAVVEAEFIKLYATSSYNIIISSNFEFCYDTATVTSEVTRARGPAWQQTTHEQNDDWNRVTASLAALL